MQTGEKEPMTYFSYEEKVFFKQNGYIVKPNTVTLELIEQALEAVSYTHLTLPTILLV